MMSRLNMFFAIFACLFALIAEYTDTTSIKTICLILMAILSQLVEINGKIGKGDT